MIPPVVRASRAQAEQIAQLFVGACVVREPGIAAIEHALEAAVLAAKEEAFKAGWASGYYDGGEHDCRMFEPTAQRAWDDWKADQIRARGADESPVPQEPTP